MKKLLLSFFVFISVYSSAQIIDTLAIQDFETVTMSPTWNYTGTLAGVQSGFASTSSTIPNTPLGIGGSTAWHVVQVSGGNPIVFNNISIPTGYDSLRVHFNLAAMNLNGSTGGPDHLDYVLVEYSLDNGATYVNRLRIRGSAANDSYWAYNATGVASVYYLPATETMFQATNTGLQVTEGYSNCEVVFPGTIAQLTIRITPRSSSSTDSWLIDNVVLTGENPCVTTTSSLTETVCDTYTAPSGAIYTSSGTYTDTIASSTGCDSVITVNLTVNNSTSSSLIENVCDSYTAPSGAIYTSSGTFMDTIASSSGCDSVITVNLTVNNSTTGTDTQTSCDSYTWIDGITYSTSNNTATFMLATVNGCDSLVTLDLTINASPDNGVTQTGSLLTSNETGASYQWLDCNDSFSPIAGATSINFTPLATGNYAVLVSSNGCSDTSSCYIVDYTSLDELTIENKVPVQILDFMGRETTFKANVPLIYVYSDGTRERVFKLGE